MSTDKRTIIREAVLGLTTEEFVDLWNANDWFDFCIWKMTADNFNSVFENASPYDIACDLSSDFDASDEYFYIDRSYIRSFNNIKYLDNYSDMVDEIVDLLEDLDDDNEVDANLRKKITSIVNKSTIYNRVWNLAKILLPFRIEESPYQFSDRDTPEEYIDEYVDKRNGIPCIVDLYYGYLEWCDEEVHIVFDADLMRYSVSFVMQGTPKTTEVILAVGDLTEEHFTDLDYKQWLINASVMVDNFKAKRA